MTAHRLRLALVGLSLATSVGCARGSVVAQTPASAAAPAVDTLSARCGPPGFGSLREEDITISIALTGGLLVAAVPLDECVIRMLSPDSYRALQARKIGRRAAIDSVVTNYRLRSTSLWSVLYYGVERGEVRFSPNEFVIRNVGRDFRALHVLPLSTGFGEYRVTQREQQRAILVLDGQIDLNQPLTAIIQGTASTTDWQTIIRRVEQERALVRSRAAAKSPAK